MVITKTEKSSLKNKYFDNKSKGKVFDSKVFDSKVFDRKVFDRERSINILSALQAESGLMMASRSGVSTGYNKAWIRDNIYESLGFEAVKNKRRTVKIYTALLDVLLKHEYKIDHAIVDKPDCRFKYIHAR